MFLSYRLQNSKSKFLYGQNSSKFSQKCKTPFENEAADWTIC